MQASSCVKTAWNGEYRSWLDKTCEFVDLLDAKLLWNCKAFRKQTSAIFILFSEAISRKHLSVVAFAVAHILNQINFTNSSSGRSRKNIWLPPSSFFFFCNYLADQLDGRKGRKLKQRGIKIKTKIKIVTYGLSFNVSVSTNVTLSCLGLRGACGSINRFVAGISHYFCWWEHHPLGMTWYLSFKYSLSPRFSHLSPDACNFVLAVARNLTSPLGANHSPNGVASTKSVMEVLTIFPG